MASFFVTYGFGTNLSSCYSKIEAPSYSEARQKAFDITGGKFAFIYDEDGFLGQPEEYHLTEVPLQPQRHDDE